MKSIEKKLMEGKRVITATSVASYEDACASIQNGTDCLVFYHTAALGIPLVAGLMPYGNAYEIVYDMLDRMPVEGLDAPKYVGICGCEPFRSPKKVLETIKSFGIDGIQNFPTIGMADGTFRYNMESVQFNFKSEVRMIKEAQELGLSVLPYVFNPSEALLMLASGVNTLIFHLGFMPLKRGYLNNRLELYLERILSFEKIVRQSWPDTKILVCASNETLSEKIYPIIISETNVNGIFHICTMRESGNAVHTTETDHKVTH